MLATYKAADTGRGNQDWRGTTSGSADLAIIPDSRVMLQRARQMVRDSWIAASAIKAASRNVVGSGITPVPAAHDRDGKPLAKVNARLSHLWKEWSGKAKNCDVEGRQNFYQKQSQLVEERFTAGESFLVWSYSPPADASPLFWQVGLKFQSFEPEMLDLTKQWYASNEVRGGVEISEDGAPVAYHFWTRNPSDYLFRRQMHSVRIPAERVLHYFKQDRVLQTRGVTPLAPVMQDMRDFARNQQAALWAAIMQTCLGAAITKNMPSGLGGLGGMGGPPASGDPGTTPTGMRKIDFVPGTVIELAPGEDVKFLTPTSPGGAYQPFTDTLLRGIGAGVGISYGLLARHFDGNYSAARQDMLEDDKQWGPEQDLLTGTTIDPLYILFVRFVVSEGRLDDLTDEFQLGEFLYDESRFTAAEHITPARPWIDPEKEMNAYEKALANQLKTREQIITEMGNRFRTTWQAKSEEQSLARKLGLNLPEDSMPAFRRDLIQTIAKDPNANSSVTNAVDLVAALDGEGVVIRTDFKQSDIKPPEKDGAATPDASGTGTPPAPGRMTIPPQNGNGNGNGNGKHPPAEMGGLYDVWSGSTAVNAKPQIPPHYRLSVLPSVRCGTCSNIDVNATTRSQPPTNAMTNPQPFCRRYNYDVAEDHTCDTWTAAEVNADTNVNRGRTLPPYPAPGDAPLDRNFDNPAADPGAATP